MQVDKALVDTCTHTQSHIQQRQLHRTFFQVQLSLANGGAADDAVKQLDQCVWPTKKHGWQVKASFEPACSAAWH